MKSILLQLSLCFLSTVLTVYLLATNQYNPLVAMSLTIVIISIFFILFYSKPFVLSGVLAGSLSGVLDLQGIFNIDADSLWFFILTLILAVLATIGCGIMLTLSDKFNFKNIYDNGATLLVLAFVVDFLTLFLGKYLFTNTQILFIQGGELFEGTNVWHLLVIPATLIGVYFGYKLNKQASVIYNQFGLFTLGVIFLIGALIIPIVSVENTELLLSWLIGIIIGTSRLPEFSSIKQYLSAGVLFALFFILFRNILTEIWMTTGLLAFLSVWIIQKIIPSSPVIHETKTI